jgi:hypothetical protein
MRHIDVFIVTGQFCRHQKSSNLRIYELQTQLPPIWTDPKLTQVTHAQTLSTSTISRRSKNHVITRKWNVAKKSSDLHRPVPPKISTTSITNILHKPDTPTPNICETIKILIKMAEHIAGPEN